LTFAMARGYHDGLGKTCVGLGGFRLDAATVFKLRRHGSLLRCSVRLKAGSGEFEARRQSEYLSRGRDSR
ncbi:MAG: hypothetical protein ACO3T7_09310, partial [Pseudomonadales bacterium]